MPIERNRACCVLITGCLFCIAVVGSVIVPAETTAGIRLPDGIQPTIGAWFCKDDFLAPEGFKADIDFFAAHTPYDLLTTSFRIHGHEVNENAMHDQVKKAVDYARERGLEIALDLDVRLAREAFRRQYPDEQQEMLRLRTIPLEESGEAILSITSETLTDHMTGNTTPYVPLSGRLVRVYAYRSSAEGIDPNTIRDITDRCVAEIESNAEVRVRIPGAPDWKDHIACAMAAFAHLTPDVYAPHLMAFQRALVMQYADVGLVGLMKDEWGFPPCHGGCPPKNDFWFSTFRAADYATASGGRDLIRDCLLMHAGEKGRERERQAAINLLLKLSRDRNAAIENHYYDLAKEFFGPKAAVVTHATWTPYPGPSEFKKNGLSWWAAKRDWGQTDEETPFPARTALAKKAGGAVWYNQYYSTKVSDYETSLWSHALGGGRINYHPLYPNPDNLPMLVRNAKFMTPELMTGECRIRLLQLITRAAVDCPAAVVFGHACAMNWAGPAYADVGIGATDALWREGYYADLIPSSEIENGALRIEPDGAIAYGTQRYTAVILYHPEFETPETAAFFQRVAPEATTLFRVGGWSRAFNGEDFDGTQALSKDMLTCQDAAEAAARAVECLRQRGIAPYTPATATLHNNKSVCPGREGQIRLIDGTQVFFSGRENVAGDAITGKFEAGGQSFEAAATGVLAVRFNPDGTLDALAAGGLTHFEGGRVSLRLDAPADIAYWHDAEARPKGVLQGYLSEPPAALLALTPDWLRLAIPSAYVPPSAPEIVAP